MKHWLCAAVIFLGSQVDAETPSPELVPQSGHVAPVTALAFSRGGNLLSGDSAGQVKTWRAASGEVLASQSGGATVTAVAWSPDSRLHLIGSGRQLAVFEAGGAAPLWTWPGVVMDAVFSRDGETVLALTPERIVYVWEARSGELRQSFSCGESSTGFLAAWRLACGANDAVAVCASDGRALLFDAKTGALRREMWLDALAGPREQTFLTCWNFSADGKTLVAARANCDPMYDAPGTKRKCRITLINPQSGTQRRLLDVEQGSGAVAVAPGGEVLAAVVLRPVAKAETGEAAVRLLDARSGALLREIKLGAVPVKSLAFSSDGATLAVAQGTWNRSGSVSLFDGRSGVLRRKLAPAQALSPVAFFADSLVTHTDSALHCWRIPALRVTSVSPAKSYWWMQAVALPDGRVVAAAAVGGKIEVTQARSGKVLFSVAGVFEGWRLCRYSGGARLLVPRAENKSGGQTWFLDIHEVPGGRKIKSFARMGEIHAVMLARDGKTLSLCDAEGAVKTLDAATGRVLRRVELQAPSGLLEYSLLSPDGDLWAAVILDGGAHLVHICDTRTGNSLLTLREAALRGAQIAFDGAGRTLAISTPDGVIRLWEKSAAPQGVANSETLRQFSAPGGVGTLCLNEDGKLLAVASGDGGLRVFDTRSGALRATLQTLGDSQWVAYSPQGFYSSSPGAASFLRWRVGENLFPAEKFAAQFHNPTLLQKSLQGGFP